MSCVFAFVPLCVCEQKPCFRRRDVPPVFVGRRPIPPLIPDHFSGVNAKMYTGAMFCDLMKYDLAPLLWGQNVPRGCFGVKKGDL